MPILQKILTWSQGLPAWQSDAIARLFIKGTLSDADLDDLFALLKTEHGIADTKGRKPIKLSADQIPVVATPTIQVRLVAMKDLRHVNAIAENIRLPFAPEGLTVIYGDNGSGKSGYSRVFKRACRARDQNEPIHPNAFLAASHAVNAEATFEVMVNGAPDEVVWTNGKPAPELPVETQSITRRPEGFGVSIPDLPFEGMNTKSRVGYLRQQQQGIKKVYQSGDELEHRKLTAEAYRQLRITWERAVEEVLLRNVVLRFRKGIETQRLSGVQVQDCDYATVDHWMSKCSNYAHDQALLGGVEVPDPDDLLADINSLEAWRMEIHDRGEKTHKIRKTAGTAKEITT